MSLASDKIQDLTDRLVNPKAIPPSEQRIEDVIDIRGTIKGIKLVLDIPDTAKKKLNQN